MKKRRTKSEMDKLASFVFDLMNQGYDPHAICVKMGERRDLISSMIARLMAEHRDFKYQISIIHCSRTIGQLVEDNSVNFVEFEKDDSGTLIIIPKIN